MKITSYSCARKKGFNLLELLVVISVIAILAAMLLPQLANHGGPPIRTECLSNEKQQVIALAIYAGDNHDNLPVNIVKPNAGQLALHPWTLDAYVANKLIANGPQPITFYDPGTEATFGPVDWFGEKPYGPVPGGGPSLWTYSAPYPNPNAVAGQSGYRITGYAFTFPGNPCYGTSNMSVFTNINLKMSTTTGNLSQKILLACATFTDSPDSAVPHSVPDASDDYQVFKNYAWTGPNWFGEKYKGALKPFISAHMTKGKTEHFGANEGMLDGHVEWRPFQYLVHRTAIDPIFYY